jgi:threonine dehydrogenase-like Zn-dependent dehydrogenase
MRAIATLQGKIVLKEMDMPVLQAGHVLIRTEYSAISPGTEMGFVKRAPEQATTLGYSAVGIVEQVGEGVENRQVGQRVACYGVPYVRHAEWLAVPTNLTANVPSHVSAEEAAFAGLGAIAIHALRVADLRFGESAVVVGLGILGNIIAQISNAAAYRTIGFDLNGERAARLRQQGQTQGNGQGHGLSYVYDEQSQLEESLAEATGGIGADAVILCASGPGEPLINRALQWIRDRGKIVIVGDLTMEYNRGLMFGKEAQMLISRAGGPGRYDAQYERDNRDYPIGYVRWTEGRNIGEYIRLLAEGRISVKPLITNIYPLERASEAYTNYENPTQTIATLIKY